jgi:peptide chain release factor 1
MLSKVKKIKKRFDEITNLLIQPEIISDMGKYKKLSSERKATKPIVDVYEDYCRTLKEIEGSEEMLTDPELKELAQQEIETLKKQKVKLEEKMKVLLIPHDPMDEKNVILEIRAGTGGGEAALFAHDLLKMYTGYALRKGFQIEVISKNLTEMGGLKEVILNIKGKEVYRFFKHESGIHRVQRVPATESKGRIHTSAVTVAVFPEADEIEVDINPDDLRIDAFRASGHGGQHVNVTDSAVRITHIPSGIVVSQQDERSQFKNKAKALKILRAKLQQHYQQKQKEQTEKSRKKQVGTGDRSEKIRTYNFPQGRITDHRINLTLYKLESVMNGDLDEIVEALSIYEQRQGLKDL